MNTGQFPCQPEVVDNIPCRYCCAGSSISKYTGSNELAFYVLIYVCLFMDVYFYIGLFIYPHLSLQISFSLPMTATPVKTSRNQDKRSAQLLIPFIYTLDIDFFSVDPFPLALK